jgi:hypothetical protein
MHQAAVLVAALVVVAAAGGTAHPAATSVAAMSSFASSPCGNATQALVPGRKNVLLVGDSISMVPPYTPGGYGGVLKGLLEESGVAVQHAGGFFSGGQCSNTIKVACAERGVCVGGGGWGCGASGGCGLGLVGLRRFS